MSLSTPARGALPALPGWAVFFFGLSLTTNVVYLFKVGNTAVPIGYVVALPLAAVLLYAGRREGDGLDAGMDRSVWLFCGLAATSLFVSLVLAIAGAIPGDAPWSCCAASPCCSAASPCTWCARRPAPTPRASWRA